MPFHVSIIPDLENSRFQIWPEVGMGWQKRDPAFRPLESENIPAHALHIQFERMALAENQPVGFYGQMTDPAAVSGFGQVLCLLHTSESIIRDAPDILVSIHCSHEPLPLEKDPLAPAGIRPVWSGHEGIIGFGSLVVDPTRA